MKTLEESWEEFNQTMNPYSAIIVETLPIQFNDLFFIERELNPPKTRESYIPPPWVGPTYSSEFLEFYFDSEFHGMRQEKIPVFDPRKKYLICDDYSNTGDTIEIAIIRLLEQDVGLDNIWGFTLHGNNEVGYQGDQILDKGIEWHKYHLRQISPFRQALQELGFKFPEFPLLV